MFSRRIIFLLFFLFSTRALLAQLCQGSLGDPLVNITFGSGGNPGPSLQAAATSYNFTTVDCPNDGAYTVRNQSIRCFNGWNSLTADHTGDPNGYFMLVNASFDPGDFYVDTVELACSNTTYEFAAWVIAMNMPGECNGNPIRPNLTFIIANTDGTLLQSFNTGDISIQSNAQWPQFGFFFNLPPLVNRVVLKVRNNAPGGCGNDLALDDITFRPCGPKLTITPTGGTTELNFCQGKAEQSLLTGTISAGFDNPYLQWQRTDDNGRTWNNLTGANSSTLLLDIPASEPVGTALYRLTAARMENRDVPSCRVASDVLTVKVNTLPDIKTAAVAPLCEGTTLLLSASGGTSYNWTGSGGFTASGQTVSIADALLSQAGRYYVTGKSAVGCEKQDSVDVVIKARPTANVNGDTFFFCEGGSAQLQASGGGTYAWSPILGLNSPLAANPVASPTDSTVYTVVVTNAEGCTNSASVAVNVYKLPMADAGPPKEIGIGQSIVLSGAASGTDVRYNWSPPVAMDNPTKLQPTVAPVADQVYYLRVTSGVGCGEAIDSVWVIVYKGIFVPTAFTPNGDGKNDVWRIFGLTVYPSYEVMVFNRWGQVVYRTKNATTGWNGSFSGQPLQPGSYPYLIRIDGDKRVLKGLVTIIR